MATSSRNEELDFQGMEKSSAMAQEPTHAIRPASCRCRPIAVSFHRLFLGGLLPSRARFRFAGYAHGIRSILTRQAHANSHTERSPLDSAAHISCRLAATPKSGGTSHAPSAKAPRAGLPAVQAAVYLCSRPRNETCRCL